MGRLAEITEAGIRTGLFDESDAREYYRQAAEGITQLQQEAMRQARENAGFNRLKGLDEEDALREVETISDKETRTNVRTRLRGHFGSEELRKEKEKEKAEEDLYELAQTDDFDTYQRTVMASPGFSPDEKDALLRKYNDRVDSIRTGRADPFKFRKNHKLYWELYKRAENGEDVRKEARSAVGWDPENPDKTGITDTDYKEIKNLIVNRVEDPVLESAIKAIERRRDAMAATLTKAKPGDKKQLAQYRADLADIEMELLRDKQSIREWFRKNPDATPVQKNQQIEAVLKRNREQAITNVADGIMKRMGDRLGESVVRGIFGKDIGTHSIEYSGGGIGGVGMLEGFVQKDKTPQKPKGKPAYHGDGRHIGFYNEDGTITLNEEGLNIFLDIANGDVQEVRRMVKEQGYKIPK
jgi:hypothetical protein